MSLIRSLTLLVEVVQSFFASDVSEAEKVV
jgi:hypothetical protein